MLTPSGLLSGANTKMRNRLMNSPRERTLRPKKGNRRFVGAVRSRYQTIDPRIGWSRREELNTPSTDWNSVALTLSYTGKFLVLRKELFGDRFVVPGPEI